ncbi:P-granule-associated novel protein 1-like [Anopheles darlingi]|uniref:P-granule-associated novel protein 1-like n=1 Tax=Anopheles darlingi TaxID=43151 RepID=UPI0021003954|nr:P-granule-associated novel protein 1-like [Anopheles darlingi]
MAYNASAFLLLFCVIVIPLSSGVHVYQCSPGTEETLCVVNNLAYSPGQDPLPQVNHSDTVNRIHLRCSRYYYYSNWNSRSGKDLLSVYDVVLHSNVLRSPRSATVINCHLHTLVMPHDLEVGDFFNNYVSEVKTDPTQSYNLRYLDLSHNNLYDLGNLSVLVNLQTLKLDGNELEEIKPETFARMTNLSILSLGYNSIVKIDLKVLPKSLTGLSLVRNSMTEIDFTSVSFVSMRELDLESNRLTGLDVASMMRACPSLQLLPIEYNPMPKDVAQRIVKELTRHNVTYYNEGDKASYSDSSCDSDEYSVVRACFLETKNKGSGSVLKAFVLILVGIVLFGVFGLSARWIWYEMRY